MRYLAIAFVLMSYPGLIYLLRTYPRYRHWAYFFIGMLPFVVHMWQLDSAIINWAAWPGYAKGIILTVEDTLALAIIATQRHPRGPLPLRGFFLMYLFAVALSMGMSNTPWAPSFYVFQLMRMAVVAMAVAKIVGDPRALQWLGMGLAGGMIWEATITIDQKAHGAFQAAGNMAHPNQLGMMAHFVILPLMGMLLAGYRNPVMMLGVVSSLVVIIAGASRATIGLVGLGVAVLLLLSLRRRSTPSKKKMIGMVAAAMVVATPFLAKSINNRLLQQHEYAALGGGYDERAAFELAATMMWKDHPMGVGANNYIPVAVGQGYSARAGVAWSGGSRGTNVHNTYLLIAAETGWVGIVTYMALLGAAIFAGWRFAFSNRNDPRGEIALASTVAIAMMAIHSQYEWITLTYHVQYVIAISFGIISGLIRLRAIERKQARTRQAAARAAAFEQPDEPALA